MIGQAITKNSLLLAGFAVFVAASLALTESSTRDRRDAAIRKVQSQALEEVVPLQQRDNILLDDYIITQDSEFLQLKPHKKCGGKNGDDKCHKIFIARKEGEISAFIFPTRAPDGYSGSIHSIVGINLDGTVSGVRIIQHAETPGLGDKIDTKKTDWVLSFNEKSLNNLSNKEWGVKKDGGVFDQFTGATITPRAVVKSVQRALTFFAKNKEQLLQQANQSNLEEAAATLKTPPAPQQEK
ncbi:MAG: electron transport complex subunit RsxG [Pseudomonadales bacterium]|nr:electron transport complex subunit RsxG [Pseudomonadales bacterium]